MLEIGTKVIVINPGKTYDTYESLAIKMKLKNWKWAGVPRMRTEFIVVAAEPNMMAFGKKSFIYGIEDENNSYLVGEEGLKVIEEYEEKQISINKVLFDINLLTCCKVEKVLTIDDITNK